jgi:ubiquinone biosynthesis protein UbiJ
MLLEAVLGFVNHLLVQEDWPRNRLRSFQGHRVRLEIGPLPVPLCITPDGLLALSSRHDQAAVTLSMPASALLHGLADRSTVLSTIKITGSADLADALSAIFRALHWDVESDLAPLLGDIAAHRLVGSGRKLLESQRRYAAKILRSLVETLTEQGGTLPSRQMVSAFSAELASLESQLAQVNSRLAMLERTL